MTVLRNRGFLFSKYLPRRQAGFAAILPGMSSVKIKNPDYKLFGCNKADSPLFAEQRGSR
jgi:hypothetical protein